MYVNAMYEGTHRYALKATDQARHTHDELRTAVRLVRPKSQYGGSVNFLEERSVLLPEAPRSHLMVLETCLGFDTVNTSSSKTAKNKLYLSQN